VKHRSRSAFVPVALWLAAALVAASACRKSAPEAPPVAERELPPLEVSNDASKNASKGAKWLYTYVDAQGAFGTTDDPAAIPEGSRRLVRVIDPSRAAGERRDTVQVYVIDAAELIASGKVKAQVISREAFETGALAQLPPGESSAWPAPADPAAPAPAASPGAKPAPSVPGAAPVVTLYGTSWCGACRSARQYMASRKIPFADKDIEKDPAAAAELRAKAARLGVPADRVPILDVRGRLLIGFDKARLEALLGEAT
jgi:glutaredoxin